MKDLIDNDIIPPVSEATADSSAPIEKHNHKYGQACNSLCSKTPSNESWEAKLGILYNNRDDDGNLDTSYGEFHSLLSKQISEAYLKGLNDMREIQSKGRGEQSQSSPAPEEEKKAMINEVIKETNSDQRLVMYKADLIRELQELQKKHENCGCCSPLVWSEVIQIIKKQECICLEEPSMGYHSKNCPY